MHQPHSDASNDLSLAFDFPDKDGLMLVDEGSLPSPASENKVTVHNILASATFALSKPLDLDKCCLALGNSYYNPAEFPALRIDVRGRSQAVYTISLFESGRIQSAGGCRPMEAKKAMMKIGRRLNERFDCGIKLQSFEIQNILAVYDACVRINVNQFAAMYDGALDYEPEVFPAARVRIPIPKKGHCGNGHESDDGSDVSTSRKLRRLMMGDSDDSDSQDTRPTKKTKASRAGNRTGNSSSSSTTARNVGSYIITSGNKRPVSSRQKDEKQAKEEVVTTNVFSTGKITFTGAKSMSSLNYAIEKLRPYICPRPVPGLLPPSVAFRPVAVSGSIMAFPHASCLDMPVTAAVPAATSGGVVGRLQQLVLEEQRQLEQEHRRRLQQEQPRRFIALQSSSGALQYSQLRSL